MEGQSIFREKNLARMSSPDQLNDYLKATSPSVWLLLTAVLIFLVGAIVWGAFGRMESIASGAAVVESGSAVCYVDEETANRLEPGMHADLGGNSAEVISVIPTAEQLSGEEGSYLLRVADLPEGTQIRRVVLSTNAADGIYHASITVESISPLSFIIN